MERGELLAGQEQKWESLMQQRRDMDVRDFRFLDVYYGIYSPLI